MNYATAKRERDRLELVVSKWSALINRLKNNGPSCVGMGLTSMDVKSTPEYKYAQEGYARAFANLRKFNGTFVVLYKAEIARDRNKRFKTSDRFARKIASATVGRY